MSDLTEATILALANPATPTERIGEVLIAVQAAQKRAKDLRETLEAAMLAHIEATGRDIVIGPIRYYAGIAKVTKLAAPLEEAVETIWTASGGDVAQFASVLRSDPFKPAACRLMLPAADYGRMFITEEREKLHEGKPAKKLLSVNTAFAGGTNGNDD